MVLVQVFVIKCLLQLNPMALEHMDITVQMHAATHGIQVATLLVSDTS
jgi:hypothetical protein